MKYGVRKPNIKKSIKARTTGKMKRQVKKAVNPLYGKKGMGVINNPKKVAYNAVYNRTTVGANDLINTDNSPVGDNSPSTLETIGLFFKLGFQILKLVFWLAIVIAIIVFLVSIF